PALACLSSLLRPPHSILCPLSLHDALPIYSSIAHAGYMLVGLVAGGMGGAGAVLFYLLTYTFTTAGAFGVLTLCERRRSEAVEVRSEERRVGKDGRAGCWRGR